MSCIRFFTCFSVCCSLVRVTTRWWTLMVATHLLPLYLGENVFPWVFRCCLLRSFPCALVPQGLPPWGVVVQGNSGRFTFFARYPLGHFLIVRCRIPFSCFGGGGGGRENILLTLLLCTAVTLTIDLIYEFPVTVGRKFTCVLDGFSDLNYVGLGG